MAEQERVESIIIPPSEAAELVARAGKVYVKECICRVREQRCEHDVDVCLHFEGAPAEDLEDATPITTQAAQAILEKTAEWNAIYQAFYYPSSRRVTELCSCCGCCCVPLREMRERGTYAQEQRTGYVAVTDPDLCVGCGQCVAACFFEARQIDPDELRLEDDRCFGCGACVSHCPEEAIRIAFIAGRGEPIPVLV